MDNISDWNKCDWLDENEDQGEPEEDNGFNPHSYITAGDYVRFRQSLPYWCFSSHRKSKNGLPSCVRGLKDEWGNDLGSNSKFLVKRVVNKGKGVVVLVGDIEMYFDVALFEFVGVS